MRFILLPSFSGVCRIGFALFDADKFGTGVISEVDRFDTEQEAMEYVAVNNGIIVEPPEPENNPSTPLPNENTQSELGL